MTVLGFSPSFPSKVFQEMTVRLLLFKGPIYNWVAFGNTCTMVTFVTSVVPLRKTDRPVTLLVKTSAISFLCIEKGEL